MAMIFDPNTPIEHYWIWRADAPAPRKPDGKRRHLQHLLVSASAVDQCDKMISEFVPDHQGICVDQVCSIARVSKQDPILHKKTQQFVFERQSVFHVLTWMHEHPFWGQDGLCKDPVERLIWYFQKEPQLIPDDYPEYGLVDNALILEAVRPFFDQALLDFSDFQNYCKQRGETIGRVDPQEWISDRVVHRTRYNGPRNGGGRVEHGILTKIG